MQTASWIVVFFSHHTKFTCCARPFLISIRATFLSFLLLNGSNKGEEEKKSATDKAMWVRRRKKIKKTFFPFLLLVFCKKFVVETEKENVILKFFGLPPKPVRSGQSLRRMGGRWGEIGKRKETHKFNMVLISSVPSSYTSNVLLAIAWEKEL